MTRDLDDLSDAELMSRARQGDSPAYGLLFKRHWNAARAMAASVTGRFEPDDLASEAFARILKAVEKGSGPTTGFRSYLATTVRNVAIDWSRRKSSPNIEDADVIEDWTYSELTALDRLERDTVAEAFYSLPDAWQEVLWYTEVEDMAPREVAPILGLTSNAVSALAARAREGLRQAWIQAHLAEADPADPSHGWTLKKLGPFVRGKLSKADRRRVVEHLRRCESCSRAAEEAEHVASRLAFSVLPLVLGVTAAASYTAWASNSGSAVASTLSAPTGLLRHAGLLRRALTTVPTASNAGVAGITASVMATAALTAGAVLAPPRAPQSPSAGRPAASSRAASPIPQPYPSAPSPSPAAAEPREATDAGPAPGPDPAVRPVEPAQTRPTLIVQPADAPPSRPAERGGIPPAPPETSDGRSPAETPQETPPGDGQTSPPEPPATVPAPPSGCEAAVRSIPSSETLFAYRLDDPAGSATATDFVHGATGAYDGSPGVPPWSLTDGIVRPPANEFTIQVWFSAEQGGGRLLGFSSTPQGWSYQHDRQLFLTDDGRLVFGVFPGVVRTIASKESYTDGRWHQATATLSGDGMTLYVDGEQVAHDGGVVEAEPFAGYWRVGDDSLDNWGPDTPTQRLYNGKLAYAAVYRTALTAAQVLTQWELCS